MRGIGISLLATVAAASLLASPVAARVRHRASVPCSKVKDAMTGGKTEEDVAKELKTTTAHVKACMNPAPKKKKSAKKA